MTDLQQNTSYDPSILPPVIVRYLEAQADRARRKAISDVFAADARVVDESIEYLGIDAIRGWLANTASEYTYTTTFTGQHCVDVDRWVVLARLEGNFPGGVADLRFQFAVRFDKIIDLVIVP